MKRRRKNRPPPWKESLYNRSNQAPSPTPEGESLPMGLRLRLYYALHTLHRQTGVDPSHVADVLDEQDTHGSTQSDDSD